MATLKISANYLKTVIRNHDELKAFALYLKLKTRFKNGIVYKYSPNKISTLFNVSEYHTRKLIKILLNDLQLIEKYEYKKETRIRLKSFRVMKDSKFVEKEIHINMKDSLDTAVTKLRFTFLRYEIFDKQQYIKDTYTNLKKLPSEIDYNQLKKAMRKLKQNGYDLSENVSVQIYSGYRKMARYIGMSISSIKSILNKLLKWHYVKKIRPFIEKVANMSYSDFVNVKRYESIGCNYFYKNGSLYNYRGTLIYINPQL